MSKDLMNTSVGLWTTHSAAKHTQCWRRFIGLNEMRFFVGPRFSTPPPDSEEGSATPEKAQEEYLNRILSAVG